jgi:hypothetical protein
MTPRFEFTLATSSVPRDSLPKNYCQGEAKIVFVVTTICAAVLLSGVDIHDFGTTFKAYRREVIQSVPLYGEMHRLIPALASWYGASICEIPIRNIDREHGKSHYGLGRTCRVFFDLLTIRFLLNYMGRPLHFFGVLGALSIMAGSFLSAILFAMKDIGPQQNTMSLHGPMFVIAAVLILTGVQLLSIGLLGELQVRHYHSMESSAPSPSTGSCG